MKNAKTYLGFPDLFNYWLTNEKKCEYTHATTTQMFNPVKKAWDEDIIEATESLPENFRLPVIYADVEGFSYKEIAEMLDIPIGTVMSRLHRGRKRLKKTLASYALDQGIVRSAA